MGISERTIEIQWSGSGTLSLNCFLLPQRFYVVARKINLNPDKILKALDAYNLQGFSHTNEGLISHLKGTYQILEGWGCSVELTHAGLCHSIYGTESYRQNPIPLEERSAIQELIGHDAERWVYLFGAHVKESLWMNLEREGDFVITDRLIEEEILISHQEFCGLVTLTLANWLEQRPRAPEKYLYLRQDEFVRAKPYLPEVAYREFLEAYGLEG